jgi:hypothetical protein
MAAAETCLVTTLDGRRSADISVDVVTMMNCQEVFARVWDENFPDESVYCGYRFPLCNIFCWMQTNRLLFGAVLLHCLRLYLKWHCRILGIRLQVVVR